MIISILLLGVSYGMLFGTLMTIQQTYEITFDRGQEFPWWFALTSILAMTSSFINASLVQRLGMRPMISAAKLGQTIFSALTAFVLWSGLLPQGMEFPVYFVWATSIFWMVGLTIGNLNALALEPMGHIAGLAASIVSCFGTVLGALIAIPIGLSFDGTPIPVMTGIAFTGFVGYLLVHLAKKQERLRPVSE